MNVEQLRRVLAEMPGDMPVVIEDCQMGWMANAALYLAPAHVDCRLSGNYLRPRHHNGADNCHALLITSLGQTDLSVVDLTPSSPWPEVIDVECESPDSPRQSIKPSLQQNDSRVSFSTNGRADA